MEASSLTRSAAFVTRFQSLETWSVAAQFAVNWNWPDEIVKPLASILSRRAEAALDLLTPDSPVTLLTIRFDGSIEPREPIRIKDMKGRLFRVYPGDVVFSKIDVRNGAIGLAPDNIDLMCVTSEFPVYAVSETSAHPEYVKLLFRTAAFKKLLNSMISGASGRKRIQPSQLESVKVPIPPLPVQQKIVANWKKTQHEIEGAKKSIATLENASEIDLLKSIGIQIPPVKSRKGTFTIRFSQNERWDTFFFRDDFILLDKQIRSMPHMPLGDALSFISRSWNHDDFDGDYFEYIEISAVDKKHGITSTKQVKINEAPSRATTLVKAGDLIISTTRPYLGAFALVGEMHDGCVCSSGFALADATKSDAITKEFVLFFLKSPAGLRQLERRMSGGLYPAIVQSELEKILLPVPPKEIQIEVINSYKKARSDVSNIHCGLIVSKTESIQNIEKLILGTLPVEDL